MDFQCICTKRSSIFVKEWKESKEFSTIGFNRVPQLEWNYFKSLLIIRTNCICLFSRATNSSLNSTGAGSKIELVVWALIPCLDVDWLLSRRARTGSGERERILLCWRVIFLFALQEVVRRRVSQITATFFTRFKNERLSACHLCLRFIVSFACVSLLCSRSINNFLDSLSSAEIVASNSKFWVLMRWRALRNSTTRSCSRLRSCERKPH